MISLIAAFGTIFFFPMNIGGKYTCFYHRVFNQEHPAVEKFVPAAPQTVSQKETAAKNSSAAGQDQEHISSHEHGSVLLEKYLTKYAFFWWGSFGTLALGVYLLYRLKRNIT